MSLLSLIILYFSNFSIYFIHITQFLNVKIFQFYKQAYENVIKRVVCNDDIKFNRFEFLTIL